MEGFGEFSPSGEEYIIGRPDTPVPWRNVLTNGSYTAVVSQSGLGYSFLTNPGPIFVTKNSPAADSGRYIFIRDNDSGDTWSISQFPLHTELHRFEVRHTIGSTTVSSTHQEIDSDLTIHVPTDNNCEIWQLKLTNTSKKKRRLSLFFYIEWALDTDSPEFSKPRYHAEFKQNVLITGRKTPLSTRTGKLYWDQVGYFGLDHEVDSFDTSKEAFVGPYHNMSHPQAVEGGKSSRSLLPGNTPIGVLQKNVTLGRETTINLNAVLGVTEPTDQKSFSQSIAVGTRRAISVVEKYKKPGAIIASLEAVKQVWQLKKEAILVNTPDQKLNILLNTWGKYQAALPVAVPNTARASFIEIADSVCHTITLNPAEARIQLNRLLALEHKEGRVVEDWNEVTAETTSTTSSAGSIYLLKALISYLKESGDHDYLRHTIPYFDGGEGSVLQHVTRLIEYALKHTSEHSFPFVEIGGKVFDSTILSCQLYQVIRELLPVLELAGEHHLAAKYQSSFEQLKEKINRHFWQDQWYVLATNGKTTLGSKKNIAHKLDLSAQSWAVLSGVADDARSKRVLDTVRKNLGTQFGPATLTPAYTQPGDVNPDISRLVIGEGENGGIIGKKVAELMMAELTIGRADQALQYWEEFANGKTHGEPYIFSSGIFGKNHPRFGETATEWDRATAGWFWQVFIERMLGIQPVIGGLKIDPCIPKSWRQVEITRKFRGADYHIRIQNPFRVNRGIDRILVDGVRLTGKVIRPFSSGSHYVEVVLG